MLTIKHYRRPISAIAISGERARLTPNVLMAFMEPLSENSIQIYAIATGEKEAIIFLDEAETDKAMLLLTDVATQSPFESISVRRGLGMITVAGPELINTPGLLNKLTAPLARQKVNIVSVTSAFDSVLFFFDKKDTERVFNFWENYVPEKINVFRKTRQKVSGLLKKMMPRKR